MNALILTSGGLIAARILNAWLSTGNSVAALWIGSNNLRRFMRQDRALGIAARSWSIAAAMRRYKIPVRLNPELSTWTHAESAIRRLRVDVLITAATSQLVPENLLALFRGRAVNFHGSVLPHYRGPNPRAGMVLDGKANLYGGVTLHCLSVGIDAGDVIGIRSVPYDPNRGFVYWDVCLARAAGSLVQTELQSYLGGTLRPVPQVARAGNYRKMNPNELSLTSINSASYTRWLCEQFGPSGWIRFRSQTNKKYVVSHFIREVSAHTLGAARISKFAIELDVSDGRVKVGRFRSWTLLVRLLMYWHAIARTWRSGDWEIEGPAREF